MFSLTVAGANLTLAPIPHRQGYILRGSLTPGDLKWINPAGKWATFYVIMNESLRYFSDYENNDIICPSNNTGALEKINTLLAQGIYLTPSGGSVNGPDWTVNIYCSVSKTSVQSGGWEINIPIPEPPGTRCYITLQTSVIDFGEIPMGKVGKTSTLNGKIQCNKKAELSFSLIEIKGSAGKLIIGDGVITYSFPNGSADYTMSADAVIVQNFFINFKVESTGNKTGTQSGSIVLKVSWP